MGRQALDDGLAMARCATAQAGHRALQFRRRCRDRAPRLQGSQWRRFRLGVAKTSGEVAPYAKLWEAANAVARSGTGPLWAVLGDSAAQGIGATAFDLGYVGLVRQRLEARDGTAWRVLNLSRSGARAADVAGEQLRLLAEVSAEAELVTCIVGGNDLLRTRIVALEASFRAIIARLPPGAVIGTVPQGLAGGKARRLNATIRAEAGHAGLRVADVWAHTGPPWRGKYAEDFFHPNDVGYQDWAAAIEEALGLPVR